MLLPITFPGCKYLGITHPILTESFLLLFREWLVCQGCSKYDFTSTYGNPLFLEHFHIQSNICFSKRSETPITSKAVCPDAGLPAKGLKQLCQCYPLVTALQQERFWTAVFQCMKNMSLFFSLKKQQKYKIWICKCIIKDLYKKF